MVTDLIYSLLGFILYVINCYLMLYLINSKFEPKHTSKMIVPLSITVFVIAISMLSSFSTLPNVAVLLLYVILLFLYVFLFRTGQLPQIIFWVLASVGAYAMGLMSSNIFVMIVYLPKYDGAQIPYLGWLQSSLVIALVQGLITILLAPRKNRNVKMSIPIMLILIIIPVLSCFILAQVAQYGFYQTGAGTSAPLHVVVSVGIAVINVAVFLLYGRMSALTEQSMEHQSQLQRASLEKLHHEEIYTLYQNTRAWRHDYRNHLQVIKSYAESAKRDELLSYMGSIEGSLDSIDLKIRSGNELLDAIINSKMTRAEACGIEFEVKISIPTSSMGIDPVDLTTLIGNLLDNSIEACERIESAGERRFIELKMFDISGETGILVKNSMTGKIEKSEGIFITSKRKGDHGIGMSQINSIVKKYRGYLNCNTEGTVFETLIHLPIPVNPPE